MKQTYEDAVVKTVLWWSDKLQTPMNKNNGDDSQAGGMAFMLMNMLGSSAQESITEDKIKVFEETLTNMLMLEEGKKWKDTTLSVDYHPCNKLAEACDKADINTGALPIKSHTFISNNNIASAKYQYGGSMVEL